jgi:hypothetical protein
MSISVSNNHNGTWTVRVGIRLSEYEYFKAPLITTTDFDLCMRLFNLNFGETA